MKVTKLNENWKFWKEDNAFALVWEIPQHAKTIQLPHDAMIENKAYPESKNSKHTGFRDGDTYVYTKVLYAPESCKNQVVKLKFEGVYMNAFVYINGQMAAKNPFGYTTFYVDLNDYLKYGQDNVIRVLTRAGAMPNSRWYSGEGIYRDVYLLESGLNYIVPEGVYVRTEYTQSDIASIEVSTEIKNELHIPSDLMLVTEICDANGECVAKEYSIVTLFGHEERKLRQHIVMKNPNLWDEENPYLYTCKSTLYAYEGGNQGKVLDSSEELFGIRTLTLNSHYGLRVNGQSVKLRGACIHHDSGLMGAAAFEDAQFRQIAKLKEAGFNAVRMAHHPMAPAMLRACDQLGMYVMDEAFDMWHRSKSDYDYGLYFDEWWEKDITAMVRKDYNHPSVIMYSVGNEICEIGNNKGAKTCYELCQKIKELDPYRYTLSAVNGVFCVGDRVDQILADMSEELAQMGSTRGTVNDFMMLMGAHMQKMLNHDVVTEILDKAFAYTDIAGYNYMEGRYERDGERYPNRVIVGSETCPPAVVDNWKMMKKHPYIIGDFTWTGWDYLGEAGAGIPAYEAGEGGFSATYPAQLSYQGDIDITGFRRPMSYLREIVFGRRQNPYIAVQNPYKKEEDRFRNPWVLSDTVSSWNWNKYGLDKVVVEVYSAGTEVELILNGKSLGRKPSGEAVGYRTLFECVYEPGTLTAISYDQSKEIGRESISTASTSYKIELTKEDNIYESELIYVTVALTDKNGVVVTDCDQEIFLEVEGGAVSMGFGSGNPKPSYNFNEGVTKTFNGRAQVILRKTNEQTPIVVCVKSENGQLAELRLNQ